ncbi:MBL fold metallo-hydrolase [Paenibacillus sacheonensis]|uniref:MBL fold metallo-hydrolase n=1 Tax=Paenibacillus sacheonensis TaxID=742054 RepID=A0A7X5BY43_9BACL|nr:MBL fold metallo-hydrolase [Paenibacillus sacheonensis]MBM7564547.1 glyoxylase-like metal-dependent hydrolase (beta-lactamase superfamily II) [Paenibacillus sacheonensis]NBC69106.1 MBL fold metallo-hydrolase [Paenibacillus sacheonensis]
MNIAAGIAMLEIQAVIMGNPNVIHPTLLWNEERVVLVDTGYPGQLPLIQTAMNEARHSLETITDIIITHQDIDHIGSLPMLLDHVRPRPAVWASELEQPYIQGERLLIKVTPEGVDRAIASLPPSVSEETRRAFRHTLLNPPHAPVDRLIGYGQAEAPIDGLIVVDTPGHTPGHISLYHQASKTLIAGDALVIQDGQLQLANVNTNYDHARALRSIRALCELDISGVICYHGGYYQDGARARILELVAEGE